MINLIDLKRFYLEEEKLINRVYILSGSLFLVGFTKLAPGTTSSLLSIPLLIYLNSLNLNLLIPINLGLIMLSIYICDRISKYTKIKDPKFVVLDEVIGMNVSLFGLETSWSNIFLAFIIFRLLDIIKPFPISYFDRKLSGGTGIVLDDLFAGIITNLLVRFLINL